MITESFTQAIGALTTLSHRNGRKEEAERWARSWVEAFPDDEEARAILSSLSAGTAQ
jgi:hypothetical protein